MVPGNNIVRTAISYSGEGLEEGVKDVGEGIEEQEEEDPEELKELEEEEELEEEDSDDILWYYIKLYNIFSVRV